MKKLVFFFAMIIALSFFFSSCQEDELPTLVPGIVYTNDPPEELFSDAQLYANSYECWLETADFIKAKSLGFNNNSYYSDENQSWSYYDSGEWYQISGRKFWGIIDGIIYLSESKDWYIIRPEDFVYGKRLIQDRKTMIAYICNGCENPFSTNMFMINGFE